MRRGLFVPVLCVFLMTACDGKYPDEAVSNFVTSCASQPGATETQCQCIIEELQERMSYEEFAQAEQDLLGGASLSDLPEEIRDSIEECV